MDVLGIVLAAVLVVVTIGFVAQPFLRGQSPGAAPSLTKTRPREVIELLEERDRALLAVQELDFDLQAGTISPADYRRLVGPLRNDAASTLRQLAELSDSRQTLRQAKSADGLPAAQESSALKRQRPARTAPGVSREVHR